MLTAGQTTDLRIVSTGPTGELQQLQEANEVRVIFSEPMVALGRIPSNPTPPWIRITPEIKGTYRWSGTTILMFTPDPATPVPHATRYSVAIDGSATSAAGRRLNSPFEFSFTTPTVRLTSARWARQGRRFDRPIALALTFNQRVRPADVVAHLAARYQPHDPEIPQFSDRERARLAALDADGLRRFEAKAAAARQTASRNDLVQLRVATDWDQKRFPPSERLVVLETTGVPPPGTFLQLTLDTRMPSPEGPEFPPNAQTSIAEAERAFFVRGPYCREECNPSGYNPIQFSAQIDAAAFASTLSVRDITEPAREQTVAPTGKVVAAGRDTAWTHNIEDGAFDRQPPAHTWALRLDPALEAIDGQTLGYPWIGIIENWHERAFTSFGDGHGVWEKDGGSQLPFYSRNFRDVVEYVIALSPSDLMPRILQLEQADFGLLPPGNGRPRPLTVNVDEIQSHGLNLSSVLSSQGTGLAWVAVRPGEPIPQSDPIERSMSTVVQVTNLGISVKDSPQSTLVFVTRLDNGEAVADARVTIINTENRQLWRGSTGRDGVAMAPALPLRKPTDYHELSFLVTAEKDGDVAYVGSDWNEGIEPWMFGHSYGLWEATDVLRGSVFADRGVYKPGEEVHLKAIVRLDTPNGIRLLPAGSTLDIRVRDARNKEVDRRTITVNRWSSAEWAWTVPADGALGNYFIRAMVPGTERPEGNDVSSREPQGEWLKQVSGSILVAAYRRPDFRVDTTLTADQALAGAPLRASAVAKYLFGNAMGGRPVQWSFTKEPTFDIPSAIREHFTDDKYQFGYYPPRANRGDPRISREDATLTTDGRFTIELDTERDVDVAYRYTFEADVEDVSRQHIANRSSVVVHPAPWYIGVRRPAYFADTKTGTSVDVVAADPQGRAVSGVRVTLSLIRVQWNSIRHAEGSGFYSWETERVDVPSGEWTIVTTDKPVAVSIPVPEGGFYQLRASASDAEGHKTRTDTNFYGIGAGYTAWERYDHNRITLEPEKRTWKPGDNARIMIQSPWETATALLTVEREGVRRYERFALTSTQQTVQVKLTEAEIPNVFVSVLLIRGRTSNDPGADGNDPGKPAFRIGYTELNVADDSKKLGVKVTADRAEYRPANKARVSLVVTDALEKPAASEVTLWAVDYGVLSLTDYRAPNVLSSVYRHKSLQVMTSDNRQRIVSRRVLTPKGAGEGGGGGSEGGFRRDFRPLAFWLGSVEIDSSGRATREVTLPDSLTTYTIMAVAGDTASRFGSGDAEIRVSKPITLLPAFPRFLAQGDRASFGALVSNTVATGGDAVVTIRSLDPSVEFTTAATQTIRLDAGATAPVRFDAVARAIGSARVQMTVRQGDNTDAFEMTLPITAPARMETTAGFGDTDGRATERLAVPPRIVPGLGGLNVELASSALVGLGEGARYLADYPYWCAEQKASSALALVLASDLGQAFAMGRIAPADYRKKSSELLAELPRYQCADGGFGYWPGGCLFGEAYLTSYVLHVMHVANGLGIAPDKDVVNRALDFLDAAMKEPPPTQVQWQPAWSAWQAFGVKVLTEYGRNEDGNITRMLGVVDRMPVFAMSYLADAMFASKSRGPRYDDLVRRLTNAARVEGDRAQIEEIDSDALAWLWNSNVRATALVLEGLVRRSDDPLFVPRFVRWLLAARKDGRWRNTQENATALEALVAYYKKFEAETPDFSATVSLGPGTIGSATFRGRSSAAQQVRLAMPDLLRQVAAGAEADLAVSRAGTGRLYYTARLQFVPAEPPPPSDQGIHVERSYARFVESGESPAGTSFNAGDLIRVTLTVTLPKERRFVAVTDALPAGVEAVDGWFRTTAGDLARDASSQPEDKSYSAWWRRGGFDHVEKFDDRVVLFATRLSEGRHEFSYLVRATTSGTFSAAGTWAEEMYAPEVNGRTAATTVVIR